MPPSIPIKQRAASREAWEQAAAGWGRVADRVRDWAIELSATMVDALALQPGQRVLELAAGPGDTGFMAAELVAPGGTLICSDGAEAMLEVARQRAAAQGISNVEFRQLELEWIDLPTADVDAVLCRWGIMLVVDSEAAAHEIRRVLKPGGRAALAVWDQPARNPWTTIAGDALIELGFAEPPDPDEPGMFKLAGDGVLRELLESAGLVDVKVRADRARASLRRGRPVPGRDAGDVVAVPLGVPRAGRGHAAPGQAADRARRASVRRGRTDRWRYPGSSLVASASA